MSGARLKRFVLDAARLIRERRFAALLAKARRMTKVASRTIPIAQFERTVAAAPRLMLLVDAAQGGGAAAAATRSAADWRDRGYATLSLGCDPLGRLTAALQCPEDPSPRLSGRLTSWPNGSLGANALEVHSLAGFTNPGQLVGWLSARVRQGLEVTFWWHDHYLICPTRHLLAPSGRYCGLPAVEDCAACLPDNPHCLDKPLRSVGMPAWRRQWGELLAQSVAIRVFSASSHELLTELWPALAPKIRVIPHEVTHIPLTPVAVAPGAPLNIGVIGHIGAHKGAGAVAALARHIKAGASEARITVLGTLDTSVPAGVVTETGTYLPQDLPALVHEHRVNVLWLPSLWPETFCFVLHEMKAMGLPILAYDVGAQREFLAGDPKARLLPIDASPDEVLTAVTDMRRPVA